jgi:CubicO group peptidase (beta-lactamase class C family)
MKTPSLRSSHLAALLVAALYIAVPVFGADKPKTAASGGMAAALQPYVDNHNLAGAVTLVASPEKVLDIETVGYSDIAAHQPMRPDSLFWIASMSKPITTAAFMMLVDEGKVNVDDPVEKYLPEFHDQWLAAEQDKDHILLKRPQHPITVKNILTHTSGLPATSAIEKPTLDLLRLREAALSYSMTPLLFEPGSKYSYANAGINTAGRIIEVVSGIPYEQFLQKRLFDPLGMTDTTFWPNEKQLRRLAKSYTSNKAKTDLEETPIAQLHYPLSDHSRQPMPAGGLFSTAHDLNRFCQMMMGGGVFDGKRYLSQAAVKQATTVETGAISNGNDNNGYGFGWSVLKRAAGKDGRSAGSFGHGGAYKTMMWVDPGNGLVMVFLRQHSGKVLTPEGEKIEEVFFKAAIQKYAGAHR